MRHSTLHAVIVVTALVTAFIHLFVLSYLLGEVSPPFVLNGLGFLVLLAAWYFTPGFLRISAQPYISSSSSTRS